jgi:Fic family protein
MAIIDVEIRKEIDEKLDKISSHPNFYDKKKKIILKELRTIGDIYSFWIENPELRRSLYLENKSPETLKKLSRKGIQSMHNGWNYLTNPNLTENLITKIGENDFETVKSLNALIMGDPSKKSCGFRKWRVDLNCEDYFPPEPEEIEEKMQETFLEVKNDYLEDPLKAAIRWHLEGAAIQPFGNGNKRTFRLIQDKILDENNYPPVIIPAGEAKYYLKLLCEALPAYEKKDFNGQKRFYDYCASKVNNGLDEILGDLSLPFHE